MMEMPQGNLREDRAGGGYAICCLVGNFFSWGRSMQTGSLDDVAVSADNAGSRLARLKEYDANRSDFPGEHLIVFGMGALLMVAGMRSRKAVWRAVMTAAGTALVGRAASGTGGIARVARVVKRLG